MPHQTMMMETATMIKRRHEYKYKLETSEAVILKGRLDPLLAYDKHSQDGYYEVCSLYFDDPDDSAVMAKVNGLNKRAKYRLRYYDHDISYINLEKKHKENGLGQKTKLRLSKDEVQALLDHDYSFLLKKGDLGIEFYAKLKFELLRPRTIVVYRRLAYYYPLGNVRITIDDRLKSSLDVRSFLSPMLHTKPLGINEAVLEIKYDDYLPSFIQKALHNIKHNTTAFSKYAKARSFDRGG